jgi:hypothetical protein
MTDIGGVLVSAVGVLLVAGLAWFVFHRRSSSDQKSGHYDPDAIGTYTWDPAIPRWKLILPGVQRSRPLPRGSGPPDREHPDPPPDGGA